VLSHVALELGIKIAAEVASKPLHEWHELVAVAALAPLKVLHHSSMVFEWPSALLTASEIVARLVVVVAAEDHVFDRLRLVQLGLLEK